MVDLVYYVGPTFTLEIKRKFIQSIMIHSEIIVDAYKLYVYESIHRFVNVQCPDSSCVVMPS